MEVRHTVQRFPGAAFALIVILAAALVTMLTLSFGVWHVGTGDSVTAPGVSQPAIAVQQPPDAQDRNREAGQQPAVTQPAQVPEPGDTAPPPCSWQQAGACSTSP